ncbi:hypothetical protein Mal15_67360 [Stieleria maiorica]|uniref:Uncharacterized protein n=1 Tax=Stieleria maiorica TaxID=2795974 RepID=A0A5B9MRT0_9BACT|nr:hypothetical protein Mal15_67360 [Stieleria maiorica]
MLSRSGVRFCGSLCHALNPMRAWGFALNTNPNQSGACLGHFGPSGSAWNTIVGPSSWNVKFLNRYTVYIAAEARRTPCLCGRGLTQESESRSCLLSSCLGRSNRDREVTRSAHRSQASQADEYTHDLAACRAPSECKIPPHEFAIPHGSSIRRRSCCRRLVTIPCDRKSVLNSRSPQFPHALAAVIAGITGRGDAQETASCRSPKRTRGGLNAPAGSVAFELGMTTMELL